MINDLCDWNKTFLGREARWIDECTPSAGSSFVTVQDWLFTQSVIDQALIGGTAIDGRGCWQFAEWQWSKWVPYVAQVGYDAITSMVGEEPEQTGVSFSDYVDDLKSNVQATLA